MPMHSNTQISTHQETTIMNVLDYLANTLFPSQILSISLFTTRFSLSLSNSKVGDSKSETRAKMSCLMLKLDEGS